MRDIEYRADARAELAAVISLELRMFQKVGVTGAEMVDNVEAVIQRAYECLTAPAKMGVYLE